MRFGIITILFIVISFSEITGKRINEVNDSLSKEELSKIRDGDIILRYGYGIGSECIVRSFNELYQVSHCGIICKEDRGFSVISSISQSNAAFEGVQKQAVERFFKDSQVHSLIVVRLKSSNSNYGNKIHNRAEYYNNKKIEFDHAYDIFDSTKFYCSEFVWKVIMDEFNIDIFKNKYNEEKEYMKFANFWNPEYFEVIINHNEK